MGSQVSHCFTLSHVDTQNAPGIRSPLHTVPCGDHFTGAPTSHLLSLWYLPYIKTLWRDDLHKDLFVHASLCRVHVCCTCELMYVMSYYYVLYHCTMFPLNLLECCMHAFLIFSVLFLVCLEPSKRDASSSPCIRSCLVCNIFSQGSQ